jgi:hypothetical protein
MGGRGEAVTTTRVTSSPRRRDANHAAAKEPAVESLREAAAAALRYAACSWTALRAYVRGGVEE